MPDGKPGILQQIKDWFLEIFSEEGLKEAALLRKKRNDAFIAIRSADDLMNWLRGTWEYNPDALAYSAVDLGVDPYEVKKIASPAMADILSNPSGWVASIIGEVTKTPAWQEIVESMGALIFDPWLASITGGKIPADSPELEQVRRFLGTQQGFDYTGNLINMLGEILSLGQVEGLGKPFVESKWLLGTCFTSWQTTSPIVESVILRPLQRLVNLTFREADFTRAQWMDLYALGKLNASRLGAELGRLGFNSEKIGWLLELAKTQPSRSDLVGMWNDGIISEELVVDGLRKAGYDQVWIDRYLRYYRKEETSDEKGAYLGTLRKAYKEKLISEVDFREALKAQGRSNVAIDLEIAVLQLDWEVEEKTTAKTDIRAAYMEDVIGRPEAERWLANADFSSHTIALLLDTWDKQRAPTFRKVNKSELLKAWATGVLTQPQVYQGLLDVGYDSNGATVLMETYRRAHMQTKPPEPYELKPSDIMWAWHTAVINKAEVLERLIELGLVEEDAEILFETFQRLHPRVVATPPQELQKNDILEAWGRGVLTEEQARAKLIGIGYSEDDATILMQSYAIRPEALPPEPTIAALIGACRRGIIDQAMLSQKLTAMGLRAEDVQFYVSYATTPLPETTRSLSRTDILKLWTEGRHDRAWALERLLAMNYSPEDCEDILWLASPEIEDTETYVLWVAELISDDIAIAMWLTMGFTQEQIDTAMGGI
uniref:Uncharacterized protein n=1 Tax=viral metagenome TaxID=1070528 RepID=A0A6H1ZWH5_9ZZZZ